MLAYLRRLTDQKNSDKEIFGKGKDKIRYNSSIRREITAPRLIQTLLALASSPTPPPLPSQIFLVSGGWPPLMLYVGAWLRRDAIASYVCLGCLCVTLFITSAISLAQRLSLNVRSAICLPFSPMRRASSGCVAM